ncbi:MAG: DegT/DnrJ/EryC1/StrS family aminotransferase [Chitinivibrionales bacterium]|nr:DegT/DnrJ/EryC1/StrS family aminotransferase [Chitinivibrionales bacterium]
MITLLPAEYWHYSISDCIRNLVTVCSSSNKSINLALPGIGNCIPVRSGRAAIIAAIKALGLPLNSRIGVPLYTCSVVFKAIKEAGCTPLFIDMDPTTYCLSIEDLHLKRSQCDAIIAVHMFGNLCDMHRIQEIVHNTPIIEDCAQSLGSSINGELAGTIGTIGIFSFRSGKYLSVGEGGALNSRNTDIMNRLSSLISTMPSPNRIDECKHIVKTYLRSKFRRKPLYGVIGFPLWTMYNKKVNYSAKSPIELSQIYNADLAITIDRLKLLDRAIHAQHVHADYYSSALKLKPEMLCVEKPGTFYNRYLYPILFDSTQQRDYMAAYLHKRHIGTIKPYNDVVEVATEHYGYRSDCPVTERISKRLLVIPSYANLTKKDTERIVRVVNEGWKKGLERRGLGCRR